VRRTATCSCGQLQVTAEGDPDRILACNCLECQRRTGSVFGVSAYFARSALRIEGKQRSFVRTAAGNLRFDTRFCPSCGSSVLWSSSALPDHVAVAVGCFADPNFPAPQLVAWAAERHPWVGFPASCRTFEGSAFLGDGA
jgi:hypothetical protein